MSPITTQSPAPATPTSLESPTGSSANPSSAGRTFASVMKAAALPAAPTAEAPAFAAAPSEPGAVHKMISDVAAGHREMDHLIKLASSGRSFSSGQLLGLQARIYRLSSEIDLASKLLEKVTSGVKQAMSTQV